MDLVLGCLEGDERAFEALFHQYKNLVYRTAFLFLGDAEEAEDALQEIFLHVHRSLKTYDATKGAFTTWLYRITVNHCLSRRRRRHPALVPLDHVPPAEPSAAFDCEHAVEAKEANEEMYQAICGLSAKLRTVLILRYYLDLSYREISEVLGIPEGTVKSRLNYALQSLHDELSSGRPGESYTRKGEGG